MVAMRTRPRTATILALLAACAVAEGADDAPTVTVGAVIFTDYTYVAAPTTVDADGEAIHPKGFDVRRAYINVTGNVSSLLSYRVTPDITRETVRTEGFEAGAKVAVSTDGSLGQLHSGRQPPDSLPRVRGERLPVPLPGARDRRPRGPRLGRRFRRLVPLQLPARPRRRPRRVLQRRQLRARRGERDHYSRDDPKRRFIAALTYEHRFVNAGVEYLDAEDRTGAEERRVTAHGCSLWATPRTSFGLEALLRYDTFVPDEAAGAARHRAIAGVAQWFKLPKGVAAAVLLDRERVTYDRALGKSDETRYALHSYRGRPSASRCRHRGTSR
jgi:hypothetical protein